MSEINDREVSPPGAGGGGGIDPKDSEIAGVLRLVASDIGDVHSKTLLQEIITSIARESVSERSYTIFIDNMMRFVNNLGFRVQCSVSKTKEIINILLALWNQPSVARYVLTEVYNEDINAAGTTVVEEMLKQIPSDVKQLDEKAIEIFSKALKDGEEEIRNIRLMVLGMFGVGKTSLVYNLIKDFRDKIIVPTSTEGIDLHRCQLMENGDWSLDNEHKSVKYKSRYKKGFNEVKIPNDSISTLDVPDGPDKTNNIPVEDMSATDDHTVSQNDAEALEIIKKNVQKNQKDDRDKNYIQLVEVKNENYIDPDCVQVSPENPKKQTTVSVWDFAGQTLYYSTHQFFLNKRSIYLVLMDMTKSLDEPVKEEEEGSGTWCGLVQACTYLDVFKFWLNAIHMYSGYQSSTVELKPTVILVGTCKDKMTGSDKEKEIQNDKYFEDALIRSFEKGSPILNHIHYRKFLVNNLSPGDPVFGQLREEIKGLAESQDYWGEKSPIRWIQMEESLDKMRDERKQLLSMEEIEKANRSIVHPLNEEELALFLDIQHRHGNILYFNTDKLKHLVVLAPQWIIDAFKCFITHVLHKTPRILDAWNDYTNLAILKPEVFNEIMDKSPKTVGDHRVHVIKYMEHLDVMAKPLKLEEVKGSRNVANDHQIGEDYTDSRPVEHLNAEFLDFHIVPCRLKKPPPPISQFTSPANRKKTQVLCFVFCEKFMPPSFFHRLVAVCIRTWPISIVGNENQLYNGLAVFDLHIPSYTLTIWYKDHIIYARISSCSKKHTSDIDFELCQNVRHILRNSMLNFVGQSVENPRTATAFDQYIQCPAMQESLPNKGMFRVKQFMYVNEIPCKACRPSHTVERAEAMQYWFKNKLDLADKDDDYLNTPAEDSHLFNAASVIGNEFWMLGIELGLTDARMNQLYDANKNCCTFIYKYMTEWRNTKGKEATVQKLNRAINAARLYCSNDDIKPVIFNH